MVQNNLKFLREDKRKTIREVAADTDIGQTAVWKMESGIQEISSQYLEKFMKYYNCTADYVLGFSSFRNGQPDKIIYKERDINYQSIIDSISKLSKDDLLKLFGAVDGELRRRSEQLQNGTTKQETTNNNSVIKKETNEKIFENKHRE